MTEGPTETANNGLLVLLTRVDAGSQTERPGVRRKTIDMKLGLILTIFFLMQGLPYCVAQEKPAERAFVIEVLKEERRDWSKLPWQEHAEKLKPLGDSVMRTLETLLTDPNLGWQASETMLVLDRDKAAPLIFASMPKSDRNIQFHTFQLYIRLIQNGEKVGCLKEMHDAAVRCLEADTNADAGEQALLAIGLTGDRSDFPLLKKLYENTHQTPTWRAKLRNAAEAALAKLGSKDHISNIKVQLSQPIPEPFTLEDAVSLVASIEKAGFTKNRDFVSLLRRHLKTTEPKPRTDYIVSPSYSAGLALDAILGKDWRKEEINGEQTPAGDVLKAAPEE